ncbi:MAG: DUF2949 domain-containing protein [Crocosphaera sp.]|nr:DUF2949 domain-containing protein [Crocosphaera sp.]
MFQLHRPPSLINFLKTDLALSDASLNLVQRHPDFNEANLPMLLWQYGLINLEQLDGIFDWLEQQSISVVLQ